jgi:RNA polymerase sigma-70 factor (ECF subfamily)
MGPDDRRLALETAYRDHAADVYRVAYAITRNTDLAEDATQEAFARAFERWAQFDRSRSLVAWLHGIVAHAALDGLRRRRVRDIFAPGRLDGTGRVRAIDVTDPGAVDPATSVIRRQATEEALARLRPRARAALVLRHYHGYDYASIAAILGTSEGNVGALISRSHATLRAHLAPDPDTRPAANAGVRRSPDAPEVLK